MLEFHPADARPEMSATLYAIDMTMSEVTSRVLGQSAWEMVRPCAV